MDRNQRRFAAVAVAALAVAPWIYFWRGARMEILLGDGDTFAQFLPTWTWAAQQWRALTPPLWAPHLYSGFPLFAEPQSAVFHPLQLLFMALPPVAALNVVVLVYHGVAGVFTYVLARQHGLTVAASALGGVVFAFCGFLLLHQGITPLLMTAASFPTVLCALGRARRRPGWGSCCLLALACLHLVLAGHPQFTFYALACGAAYGLHLLAPGPAATRRSFALTAGAGALLGLGLSAVQLVPTAELMLHSVRDRLAYADFVGNSYSPPLLLASLLSERMTTVLPIDGTEGALNVGALPLLLAGFGIVLRARSARFWIGLLIVASLLWMGDGTPLYSLMYHVPGYNLFRTASRNGLMVEFAVAMLAAHGVDALQRRRGALPAGVRLGLLALVPLAVVFGWRGFGRRVFHGLWKAAAGSRLEVSWETAHRVLLPLAPALAVLALATVVVVLCLWWGRGGRVLAALCIVLTMAHFWNYRNWLFAAPAEQVRRSLEPEALAAPLRAPPNATVATPYRIALGGSAGWPFFLRTDRNGWRARYVEAGGVDVNMLHRVSSIGGYSPLMLRDYARLAGGMQMWGAPSDPALFRSAALDLLAVRYVAVPEGKLGFPATTFAGLVPVTVEKRLSVYRNPGAPGLVWAVDGVEAASDEQAWAAITGPRYDLRRAALLAPVDAARLAGRRFARPDRLWARWRDCNTLAAEVEAAGETLLAVSLLHYPGWRASVDGERVPLLHANGLFSALVVPAGRHRVELRYRPASLGWGTACAALAVAAMAAGTLRTLLRRRRRTPAAG